MQSPRVTTTAPTSLPNGTNLVALPTVLMLGCDEALVNRCRNIASRAKVLLRSMPVPFQRNDVAALRPLVIMAPKDVYEGAPWGFEVLAERIGASLLVLGPDPLAPIVLEYRMMEALVFASRLRRRVGAGAPAKV